MTQIHHHAHTIHLFNHLLAKFAHTPMFVLASRRITNVVVAIMTKGHIDDTTFTEGLYVTNVLANRIAIFNAQHNGTLPLLLQSPEVIRRVGNIHSRTVLSCHLLDLCEDLVGFGRCVLQRCIITFLLLQISHHDSGIKMSFCHLMEVNQYLGIA